MTIDRPGDSKREGPEQHPWETLPLPSSEAVRAANSLVLTRREVLEWHLRDPAMREELEKAAAAAGLSRVEDLFTTSLDGKVVRTPGPLPPQPGYGDYVWENPGISFRGFAPGPVYYAADGTKHCIGSVWGRGANPSFTFFRTRFMLDHGWVFLTGEARDTNAGPSMDLAEANAGLFSFMVEASPHADTPAAEFAEVLRRTFCLYLWDALHVEHPLSVQFGSGYASFGTTVMLFAQALIQPHADQQAYPWSDVDLEPLRQTCAVAMGCQPGQESRVLHFYLHRVIVMRV
ncbi:MAG: hypothetical protein WCP21_03660 [Armatimonadota bacterium]